MTASISLTPTGKFVDNGYHRDDITVIDYYPFTTFTEEWPGAIQSNDLFGYSSAVSADGTRAIIGAYGDDANGNIAGVAYIYVRSGNSWVLEQEIEPLDAAAGQRFGWSVDINSDGSRVVIGASLGNVAYTFSRSGSTWTQATKLIASDQEPTDLFGFSVAISGNGNHILIGSSNEDAGGSNSGSAYYFFWTGAAWVEQQKIVTADLETKDFVGTDLALNYAGDVAVITAGGDDLSGTDSDEGSAYIFTRSGTTWTEGQKLVSPVLGDRFGRCVAMSDDSSVIAIGTEKNDDNGVDSGAVFIFRESGGVWSQAQQLEPLDAAAGQEFGWDVTVAGDGETVAVGAYNSDGNGAVYVFGDDGGTFVQREKLQISSDPNNDQIGRSVSISGDGGTLLVGASSRDSAGVGLQGGSVIFYMK